MSEIEKILNQLEKMNSRLDEIEVQQKTLLEEQINLNLKLGKHIDFIDKTYEGLKNPIKAATRFLGR